MYGAHFNRFAFAWYGHGRWIVATERGGFAYSNPIYVIVEQTPGDSGGPLTTYPARLIKIVTSRPASLCSDAERSLEELLPTVPTVKPATITRG